MSKKRGRSKQKRAHKLETSSGVPSEEILAEGSGPVGEAGEIPPVQAADESDDAALEASESPGETAEAVEASAADREPAGEPAADASEAPSEATTEATIEATIEATSEAGEDAEPSGRKGRRKKGKGARAKAEAAASEDAEGTTSEVVGEPAPDGVERASAGEDLVAEEVAEAFADGEAIAEHAAPIMASDDSAPDGEDVAGAVTFAAGEAVAEGGEVPALEVVADGEGDGEGDGAALPTSAASFDSVQLKQLVEALIFASDKPLTLQRIRQLTRVADMDRLQATLVEITQDYEQRGLVLQQVSGGYQFRTRPQFSVWVQQLIQGRPVRLSRAQLETLAIVAYRQPITRPEIDDIRGVDSSATLKLLMDRLLIRVLGKKEEAGRPMLYGTTKEFLDFFSLGDLRELPTLREYSELSDESRQVITSRLGPLAGDGGGSDDGSDGGSGDGGGGEGGAGPVGGDPSGGGEGGGEAFDAAPEPGSEAALRAYTDSIDLEERAELDAYLAGEGDGDEGSDAEAELRAEAVADADVGSDADADADAGSGADADSELRAEAASDSDSDSASDSDSDAGSDSASDAGSDTESELRADANSGSDAGTELRADPASDSDARSDTNAGSAFDADADAGSDADSELRADAASNSASDADADAASGSGADAELLADAAAESDSASDADAGSDADSELRADAPASDSDASSDADADTALHAEPDADLRAGADSEDAIVSAPVESDELAVLDAPALAADADLVASAADTALVASAIDAAFADVVRANPVPSERPFDDAAPDAMFAEGSLGTDFPSPEQPASDAAPEPMLAAGSMSNFAAVQGEEPDDHDRSKGDVPTDVIADEAAAFGNPPAPPVTE